MHSYFWSFGPEKHSHMAAIELPFVPNLGPSRSAAATGDPSCLFLATEVTNKQKK
jgi:hypothetical protein